MAMEEIPTPSEDESVDQSAAWKNAQKALAAINTTDCEADIPLPPTPTPGISPIGNAQQPWFPQPVPMYYGMYPMAPYGYCPPPVSHPLRQVTPVRFGFNSRPQQFRPPPIRLPQPQEPEVDKSVKVSSDPTPPVEYPHVELNPSHGSSGYNLRSDQQQKGPTGKDVPEAVKAYTNRAFAACTSQSQRNAVERKLNFKLLPLLQSGEYLSIDWDKEPIPTEPGFTIKHSPTKIISPFTVKRGMATRGVFRGRGSRGAGRNVFSNSSRRTRSRSSSESEDDASNVPAKRKRTKSGRKDSWNRGGKSGTNDKSRRSSGSTSSDDGSSSRSRNNSNHVSSPEANFVPLKMSKGARKRLNKQNRLHAESEKFKGKSHLKHQKKGFKKFQPIYEDQQEEAARLQSRAQRFAKTKTGFRSVVSRLDRSDMFEVRVSRPDLKNDYQYTNSPSCDLSLDSVCNIVGTSEEIEKSYFRLTTHPDPSQVRPERVLVKALELVKQKWAMASDYGYACNQLKSIRQDLTIQGIRNSFTVSVYEAHGRIALVKNDVQEFNQCQTQLKSLYQEIPDCPNEAEFTAYRLMYFIYMDNTLDIATAMTQLSEKIKKDECVKRVLSLCSAWTLNNYHRFFALSANAEKMLGYLLDMFVTRQRKTALKTIIKAYRPTVTVDFVSNELGFRSIDESLAFLEPLIGIMLIDDRTKIDCRIPLPKAAFE